MYVLCVEGIDRYYVKGGRYWNIGFGVLGCVFVFSFGCRIVFRYFGWLVRGMFIREMLVRCDGVVVIFFI